ncbi:hypothetical protein CBS101457_003602 [Exobasidium rhododendri]|nr:hypothetical protein CBS101457_003602 [Exobasidium rhododendri]
MSSIVRLFDNGTPNLSVFSLPITLFIAALPHWYTIYIAESNKIQGGWSNENPRAFVARLNSKAASGKKLNATEEMILRGQSAQQNGFEWFPVWAAAVILGNMAKLPKDSLNTMTLIHLALRLLYYYIYVTVGDRKTSYIRTAVFQIGLIPAITIMFKAAHALQ